MRRKNDNIKIRAAADRFPIREAWPQSAIMAIERNEPPRRRRFGPPTTKPPRGCVYEVNMNDYWAAMMKINSEWMKTATAMFQLQTSWAKVMTEAMKSMQNIGASFDKK